MQPRHGDLNQMASELCRRCKDVPLRQSHECIRIGNAEVPFAKIIAPRQAQNVELAACQCAVCVAVEIPMQQHIAGFCDEAAGKSRLFEGAGEHHGCVSAGVSVPGQGDASVESLDSKANLPVPGLLCASHVYKFGAERVGLESIPAFVPAHVDYWFCKLNIGSSAVAAYRFWESENLGSFRTASPPQRPCGRNLAKRPGMRASAWMIRGIGRDRNCR